MTDIKFVFFVFLILVSASTSSYARHAAIVVDAENGMVIHEQDASQPWFPASLTKVMTIYLTFESLKSGRLRLSSPVTVSAHAASQPKSRLGLRQGEHLTTEEAILATIMRSANDAAVVLAEEIGGNEANFAQMMTAKAHALGMSSSQFMNATGLPHLQQITTSRDMALLALRLQHDFPEYYQYFGNHNFNYKGQTLKGINAFTANYPGAEGLKTGFTCGSGYNLLAAARQNGRHLIGVILGGTSSKERYQLMYNIMDAGFTNKYDGHAPKSIYASDEHVASTPPYQLACGEHAASSVSLQKAFKPIPRPKISKSRVSKTKAPAKVINTAKLSKKPVTNTKPVKTQHKKTAVVNKKSSPMLKTKATAVKTLNKKAATPPKKPVKTNSSSKKAAK
ncbi:MAG: serine hydrolase [Methylococcaceae bacterium]|jgi:D-alanyl-D-alanine carboxypeptidase